MPNWSLNEKQWLAVLLAAFILLGSTYAITTPAFEASDELWHYPMVRHLADGNPLPVQVFDPALAGPWKQEASQPPLYYYVAAALTFWIDASDMEQVRWENPHVSNGIITEDGNINLVVRDPANSPWQGALLAVRIIRLASVLMGAATVYLTFLIAKEVVPNRPELALGATAVTAFLPMFLFISGAVNNDNLIVPLAAGVLLLLIRAVTREVGEKTAVYQVGYWLFIGLLIGLAALTKLSGIGLLPLAWGTLVITQWQRQGRQFSWSGMVRWVLRATVWFLLVAAVTALVAGWWYWRNVQLYDDWRGWTAFIAVLGQRAHPASIRQLWAERWGFMLSYWGLFGGVNVPMSLWIYHLLNGVVVLAIPGFVIYLFQIGRAFFNKRDGTQSKASGERLTAFNVWIANLLSLVERHFGLLVCLLWAGAVVYGIVDWATITWSSQGRLVFSALPALSILMVVGLAGWLRPFWARWVLGIVAGFMAVVALLAPFVWIRPAYQPLLGESLENGRLVDETWNEQLRLVRAHVEYPHDQETAVFPGDTLWVELEWEALAPMDRNWTVFVHLNDPVIGRPIAQRDMYLGQGLLGTTVLEPGDKLVNRYALPLPPTAVSPADLSLVVGLYDYATGERLPIDSGGDAWLLETVMLASAPGDLPNATAVNFEDELLLRGYALSERRLVAGSSVTLTLYMEAQRPLDTDYTFFAQIVDVDTTRWAASTPELPSPTSTWPVGEVQQIELTLPVQADTPANVYPLILGMYVLEEGNFNRLQIMAEDGRPTDDFLSLTLIRIELNADMGKEQ